LSELPADEAFDLIVNCTPVGGPESEGQSPLPESFAFRGCDLCYDLIYWPVQTAYLRTAQAAGCRAINGLPMLVRQAVESFMVWTGRELDAASLSAEIVARIQNER
jgi:shikimate dehydrogenase